MLIGGHVLVMRLPKFPIRPLHKGISLCRPFLSNTTQKERGLTMKKSIWVFGISLVLFFTFGLNIYAQPKEGVESATTTFYATSKVLSIGEDRLALNYEAFGVTINDTGEGLFHNATVRVLGGMTIEKGVYKDERGWGVFNLQTGDKIFFTHTMTGLAKPGGIGTGKGTATFTGGTGKLTNIQGGYEMTRTMVRSAIEGIGQSYTRAKIQYKLP